MIAGCSPSGAGGQESVYALAVSRQIFAINTTAGWALVPADVLFFVCIYEDLGQSLKKRNAVGKRKFRRSCHVQENNRNSQTIKRASTTFLFPQGFSVEQ